MTLYLDVVRGKGRGVFASKDFAKGDVIEICPVIILTPADSDVVDKTILQHYNFAWGKGGVKGAICLGYGSIYNHSHDPNANFVTKAENTTIVFYALRDIKKGEEICTDYGWDEEENYELPSWYVPVKPVRGKKSSRAKIPLPFPPCTHPHRLHHPVPTEAPGSPSELSSSQEN